MYVLSQQTLLWCWWGKKSLKQRSPHKLLHMFTFRGLLAQKHAQKCFETGNIQKGLSPFPICHQSFLKSIQKATVAAEEQNLIFCNCPRVSVLDVLRNRCYKLNEFWATVMLMEGALPQSLVESSF